MRDDPIVEQVRRVRAKHSREHGNDLEAIFRDMKRQEKEQGRKAVSLPAKRPLRITGS
jgi:hypothetical protein